MKPYTTYYKTEEFFEIAVTEKIEMALDVYKREFNCNCGESVGYDIYDNDGRLESLILCESCYEDATNIQRGE